MATYYYCKLCQKPIFRKNYEVLKRWGRGYTKVGLFHKSCADKYIRKEGK